MNDFRFSVTALSVIMCFGLFACVRSGEKAIAPTNELEVALIDVSKEKIEQKDFESILMRSMVYLRVNAATNASAISTNSRDVRVNYFKIKVLGADHMAVYTSQSRVSDVYGPGNYWVKMLGRDAFKLAIQGENGVVLNPGLTPSVVWSLAQVKQSAKD